jgi:hypothetical protein
MTDVLQAALGEKMDPDFKTNLRTAQTKGAEEAMNVLYPKFIEASSTILSRLKNQTMNSSDTASSSSSSTATQQIYDADAAARMSLLNKILTPSSSSSSTTSIPYNNSQYTAPPNVQPNMMMTPMHPQQTYMYPTYNQFQGYNPSYNTQQQQQMMHQNTVINPHQQQQYIEASSSASRNLTGIKRSYDATNVHEANNLLSKNAGWNKSSKSAIVGNGRFPLATQQIFEKFGNTNAGDNFSLTSAIPKADIVRFAKPKDDGKADKTEGPDYSSLASLADE